MVKCRCAEIPCLEGVVARYRTMDAGVGAAKYASAHLVELVYNSEKWDTLYGCPETGRLWRDYFPYPSSHGGGPMELVPISPEAAAAEFGWAPPPDKRLQAIRAAKRDGPRFVP